MRKNMKTAFGVALAAAMLITPVLANADVIDGSQSDHNQAAQTQNVSEPNQNQNTKQQKNAQLAKPQSQQDTSQNSAKKDTAKSDTTENNKDAASSKLTRGWDDQPQWCTSTYGRFKTNMGLQTSILWYMQQEDGECVLHISSNSYTPTTNTSELPDDYRQQIEIGGGDDGISSNWVNDVTEITFEGSGKVGLPSPTPDVNKGLFSGFTNLKTFKSNGRVYVYGLYAFTRMNHMFADDVNLTNVDVKGWFDGQQASYSSSQDWSYMFANCRKLTNLDLSSWNVSKVADFRNMFEGCTSLSNLNLTGWSPKNVQQLTGMFTDCKSLTGLDLSGWDVTKVTSDGNMFSGCDKLATLNLSGWDTATKRTVKRGWPYDPAYIDITDHANFFSGLNNLSQLTIGPKTKLIANSDDSRLDNNFDGKWVQLPASGAVSNKIDMDKTYTTEEMAQRTQDSSVDFAGTYVWVQTRTLTLQPTVALPDGTHLISTNPKTITISGVLAKDVPGAPSGVVDTLTTKVPENPYRLPDSQKAKRYEFDKWTTNADGTGNSYNVGDPLDLTDGDLTLYALWKTSSKPDTGNGGSHDSGKPTDNNTTHKEPGKPTDNDSSKPADNNSGKEPGKPTDNTHKEPGKPTDNDSSKEPGKPADNDSGKTDDTPPMKPSASASTIYVTTSPAPAPAPAVGPTRTVTRTVAVPLTLAAPQTLVQTAPQFPDNNKVLGGTSPKDNTNKKHIRGCENVSYIEGSVSPAAYECQAQSAPLSSVQTGTNQHSTMWLLLLFLPLLVAAGIGGYYLGRDGSFTTTQHAAR